MKRIYALILGTLLLLAPFVWIAKSTVENYGWDVFFDISLTVAVILFCVLGGVCLLVYYFDYESESK